MMHFFRSLLFSSVIFLVLSHQAAGQDQLFWEYPEPVNSADGGRFYQVFSTDSGIALLWQEFQGNPDDLDGSISIKATYSKDGQTWNSQTIDVTDNLSYLWINKVPLYSAAVGPDGRIVVAVATRAEGVDIYRQDRPGPDGVFRYVSTIASGPDVADVAVAPRINVDPSGNLIVFFTRRAVVSNASRPTILTIYYSESTDGVRWTAPGLFVNPVTDLSINGEVLEQNFLPSYLAYKSKEYVVFQTLRQGDEGQVYQLYAKVRTSGGNWSSTIAITEQLRTSDRENDPLLWDNQRPFIGLSDKKEILIVWERARGENNQGIALCVLGENGNPQRNGLENILIGNERGLYPNFFVANGSTWILWITNSGIRLARRKKSFSYDIQAAQLNNSAGEDRGTAVLPRGIEYRGNPYVFWTDSAGGRARTIFLRPDLKTEQPRLKSANFRSGKPGNVKTLSVNWSPPQDSSGIAAYSWIWSRNPDELPPRDKDTLVYNETRSLYEIENPKENEGLWYFALSALDNAGNWSKPFRLTYILDVTPPLPPVIESPPTDSLGFLRSNTFSIKWEAEESVNYYRTRMVYLGLDAENFDSASYKPIALGPGEGRFESGTSVSWRNIDDGVWAFSVLAVDKAGNQGILSTRLIFTNQYIPVTYISGVSSVQDQWGTTVFTVVGRGFSVGGDLVSVILDKDGQKPYDYVFYSETSQVEVKTDRVARVIDVQKIEKGTYRIGVIHPQRGLAFWKRTIQVDSVGTIKFGPFGIQAYKSIWEPAAHSLNLTGNRLLLLIVAIMVLSAFSITGFRFVQIVREVLKTRKTVRAVLENKPLGESIHRETLETLRRKGMKLRGKFTLALGLLVIIIIALIATGLGIVWLRLERVTLTDSLERQSRLLVETLASSAKASIPSADRGNLLLLPDRISALPDAVWTTVTGPRSEVENGLLRATGEESEYIWASNDPNILEKLRLPERLDSETRTQILGDADENEVRTLNTVYPETSDGGGILDSEKVQQNRTLLYKLFQRNNILPSTVGLGVNQISDVISPDIREMQANVESAAQEAGIANMISNLAVLEEQYAQIAADVAISLDFDNPSYIEADAAVAAQRKEIETLLLEISNQYFTSYPPFSANALAEGGTDEFVFYKPLLYRIGNQDSSFFRGVIRLDVSVDEIKQSLATVQTRIFTITIIASMLALIGGILVSLFIASFIVRPIVSLASDVDHIRQNPDMTLYGDFDVRMKTKDELAQLAETITQMVRRLFLSAQSQKELVLGKEVQKKFIPLTPTADGTKLSTGIVEGVTFRLFGYYEGADEVSGDYFDFRQIDKNHYAMIKCDISGHGVTAGLIMVQVASLFIEYFRRIKAEVERTGKLRYSLRDFTFGVNDIINEIQFEGRFAAFNLSIIDVRSSNYEMIHAGDNQVYIYDREIGRMKTVELPQAPAAGQILSEMIGEYKDMYKSVKGELKRGDILYLFTDGFEESAHNFRKEDLRTLEYQDFPEEVLREDRDFIEEFPDEELKIKPNELFEEFGFWRIRDVIEAALNQGSYTLRRRCDVTIGKPLHFDFSSLRGTGQESILAVASVEKVFRLVPGTIDVDIVTKPMVIDKTLLDFLKEHFLEYDEFFQRPGEHSSEDRYITFDNIMEDKQGDDLTFFCYERL